VIQNGFFITGDTENEGLSRLKRTRRVFWNTEGTGSILTRRHGEWRDRGGHGSCFGTQRARRGGVMQPKPPALMGLF